MFPQAPRPSLVVTADDFGYSATRDDGILHLFSVGAITRASLLVNGASAARALSLAHAAGLPVGLHLNLTEGAPLSGPATSLLAPGARCMRGKFGFRAALAAGEVALADVAREAAAQAAAFTALHPLGCAPAHLDGHQHVHVLPGVAGAVAAALRGRAGATVRLPVWAGEGVEPLGSPAGPGGAQGAAGGPERAEFYRAVSADAGGAAAAFVAAGFAPSSAVFAGFSLSPTAGDAGDGGVASHRAAIARLVEAALAAAAAGAGMEAAAAAVELMVHPGWRALPPPAGAPPLLPPLPPALEALRAGSLAAAAAQGARAGCCACCGADAFSLSTAREVELAALAALAAGESAARGGGALREMGET
jgi:hypothetical protein